METEKKEKKDLRETRDTLKLALWTVEMRKRRLGLVDFTVADLTRFALELVYQAEVEILRAREEKFIFEVSELPA